MLERVKYYAKIIGAGLLVVLSGVVYFLLGKNTALRGKLEQEKSGQELKDIIMKKQGDADDANKAEDEYRALRDTYLNSGDGK